MKALTHSLTFLLGLLGTAFYYRLAIWPSQIEQLRSICTDGDLGYPGDWVLDIFFPVIPLVLVLGIVWICLMAKGKVSK